ncbi:MAG: Gp19/Gp15/Gp42 family protein [Nocardioides sp.]|uniref:Gp19/Gp15/Gp42 family protein n=1 Tax=Nocardioides sp. TaxID=35761 RepID=UPI0039E46DAC
MPNPASPVDIEVRWRSLSTQETTNAVTFLDDAWRMLRRRIDNLEAKVLADSDLAGEVIRVMATAVLRVMKNPDGNRQESIDDYSWTRDQAVSAGLLYFTDDELNDLYPGLMNAGRAYTIDPLAGRDWGDWS